MVVLDIMDTNLVAAQWSIEEIENLYINLNYSMNLVSRVTHIPIAPLSRILWKYGLPDRKRERYGPTFVGELNRLPEHSSPTKVFEKEENLEDSFFSEL